MPCCVWLQYSCCCVACLVAAVTVHVACLLATVQSMLHVPVALCLLSGTVHVASLLLQYRALLLLLHPLLLLLHPCCMHVACRAKLHHNAAAVHIPIGLEGQHMGVVDLIANKAVYFEGTLGFVCCFCCCYCLSICCDRADVVEREVPTEMKDLVSRKHRELIGWTTHLCNCEVVIIIISCS